MWTRITNLSTWSKVVIAVTLLVVGCQLFITRMITSIGSCGVYVTEDCIESDCRLGNGAYFEKLADVHLDSVGLPDRYTVIQQIECFNSGFLTGERYDPPTKIYFHKKNGQFKWRFNDAHISFEGHGRERSALEFDSTANKFRAKDVSLMAAGKGDVDLLPVNFERDTWYYINIYDPRVSGIYLYVDTRMNFKVFTIDSGVSPI